MRIPVVDRTRCITRLRSWLALPGPGKRKISTPDPRHTLGYRGERAAARYLRKKGYRIIQRRLHSPLAEIDIIAVDHRTVVFVEVKTRRSAALGRPAQSVHATQQARLTRGAIAFLKSHGLLEVSSRFDVMEILWPLGKRHPEIRHHANAFPAVGHRQFYR